jgi:hypothetical protein
VPDTIRIGIIGCGTISPAYFGGCRAFDILDVVACADVDMDRARARAEEFGIPTACSVERLLADPAIQIVVNLTTPQAHAEVNLAAIAAGKHVYCEKPLAITRADGQRALAAAREAGVRVGCAPDTFLGLPQAGRRRLDRRTSRRHGLYDLSRPRKLASRSGLLLSGGRRADARYGALLPDRAGQPDWPNPARDRLDPRHLPRTASPSPNA